MWRVFYRDRDLLDDPAEYIAALDEPLPAERNLSFADIHDRMGWVVYHGPAIAEEEHGYGYRSATEVWNLLREQRESYRAAFGR